MKNIIPQTSDTTDKYESSIKTILENLHKAKTDIGEALGYIDNAKKIINTRKIED